MMSMLKHFLRQIGDMCVMLAFVGVLTVTFSSCDSHEPEPYVDLGIHPGHILCIDGNVMSADDYFTQPHVKAAAVIFTEQLSDDRFLAVMLHQLDSVQFCDSLGLALGTSGDFYAYDGYSNTTAMQHGYDAKTGHGSPLAAMVFRSQEYGQSGFVPSVGEMRLLYQQRHIVNGVLQRLIAEGDSSVDSLSVDLDNGRCLYWTSTEVSANKGYQSWVFSMSGGNPEESPVDNRHMARVITSYYPIMNK